MVRIRRPCIFQYTNIFHQIGFRIDIGGFLLGIAKKWPLHDFHKLGEIYVPAMNKFLHLLIFFSIFWSTKTLRLKIFFTS